MKISKQKRNLINELSFWILKEIDDLNQLNKDDVILKEHILRNKQDIKKLINIVKCSKEYTNKQIKQLINELKFQLPF